MKSGIRQSRGLTIRISREQSQPLRGVMGKEEEETTMSARETVQAEPEFVAFVGIDWADQKHVWCWQAADTGQCASGELEHKPEVVEAWVSELCQRFGHGPIAVAVEQVKGALVYMLRKYECLHLYPVPSTMSASMRAALYPSGAKDDPRDADLLLELLVLHRDKLRRLMPDNEATRRVQNLVEERRKLVEEKTAQLNRLTGYLKVYFPQMLGWFAKLDSHLVCDFLERLAVVGGVATGSVRRSEEVLPPSARPTWRANRMADAGDRPGDAGDTGPGGDRGEANGGASHRTTAAHAAGGDCDTGPQDRGGGRGPSRFFHFSVAAGSGSSVGAAPAGRFGFATRSVWECKRGTEVQRDRSRNGAQRKKEMGALPLGVFQILAAEFSRMGGPFDRAVGLGACLLPATARAWQGTPCRREGFSLQMDSHRVSLLARSCGL